MRTSLNLDFFGTFKSSTLLVFYFLLHQACGYITGIAVRLPLQGPVAPPGSPWPMPQSWDKTNTVLTLDPASFRFTVDVTGCDVIDFAISHYRGIIRLSDKARPESGRTSVAALSITVQNKTCASSVYPHFLDDESYDLSISDDGSARLSTKTIWGVRRGLETFSQLIYLKEERLYNINSTTIKDFPRFHHRGLMIDTARHFLPMSIILQILEGMAYDKLNVLHWHVVDDQSFPYPLTTYPNMSTLGSYSPAHRYSREDVTALLREARLRGIRVVPEFDTPGHTWSWGQALPELLTPCWKDGKPYQAVYGQHGRAEILNPIQEYTYSVLDAIYEEITHDFPDEYVHLGMDEVYHRCWQTNPNITDFMKLNNISSYEDLESYYSLRLIDIAVRHNTKFLLWQEPVDKGIQVHNDTIVEVWKDNKNDPRDPNFWQQYAANVTDKGYNIIVSAPWYLNMIKYGQDWKQLYTEDPMNFTTDPEKMKLVQGGEACIWAEYVDGSNIVPRIWPRLSAVSERLWSSRDIRDPNEAQFRLDQHRCRYVRRGIAAQPLLPGYCGDYDLGFPRPQPTVPPCRTSRGLPSSHLQPSVILSAVLLCQVILLSRQSAQ